MPPKQELMRKSIVPNPLGRRERLVLQEVGKGLSNSEIAYKLQITTATVNNQLTNVANKMIRLGYIDPEMHGKGGGYGNRGISGIAVVVAAEHGLIKPIPLEAAERHNTIKGVKPINMPKLSTKVSFEGNKLFDRTSRPTS